MFLLDTNICIYISKNPAPSLRAKFEAASAEGVAMSVVSYAELCFGAAKSSRTELVMQGLRELRELVPVLPLTEQAGEIYGKLRRDLERRRLPIGAHDMLIAAHTIALGATLVTNNLGAFHRIPDLKLDNWV